MSQTRTKTRVRTPKREIRRRAPAPAPQLKRRRPQPQRKPVVRRHGMAPELKVLTCMAAAVVLVLGLLVYPFEQSIVPAWSVQVVDENNHPLVGVDVQQEWGQFGPHEMAWADSRVSGVDGWIDFPERVVEAPLGPRVLKSFFTSGIPPLQGREPLVPAAHIFVCRQGKTGEITWDRAMGRPQERLFLHKGSCQYSDSARGI